MHHGAHEGWVEVVSGVMFSGKSEEMIRRVRWALVAKTKVQVFKSHLDDRYGGAYRISSHEGTEIEAIPVSNAVQIAQALQGDTEVVAVDEARFLNDGTVALVNDLADRGVRVIAVGTDMDFRGEPFGPRPQLLAVAERIDKLHAICVVCGDLATRNQRLIDGAPAPAEGPTIQVGGSESYEARCRACHVVPGGIGGRRRWICEGRGWAEGGVAPEVRRPQGAWRTGAASALLAGGGGRGALRGRSMSRC